MKIILNYLPHYFQSINFLLIYCSENNVTVKLWGKVSIAYVSQKKEVESHCKLFTVIVNSTLIKGSSAGKLNY